MRYAPAVIVLALSLALGLPPLLGQDQPQGQPSENRPKLEPDESQPGLFTSLGKRDPFKDLLAGAEASEKSSTGQGPQLSIDDIFLIAIVKERGKLVALVNTGPQGFPHKIKPGDKFADGYVLSISESNVVFRKTSDRGVRLPKPRDVIKEISQEEL